MRVILRKDDLVIKCCNVLTDFLSRCSVVPPAGVKKFTSFWKFLWRNHEKALD